MTESKRDEDENEIQKTREAESAGRVIGVFKAPRRRSYVHPLLLYPSSLLQQTYTYSTVSRLLCTYFIPRAITITMRAVFIIAAVLATALALPMPECEYSIGVSWRVN